MTGAAQHVAWQLRLGRSLLFNLGGEYYRVELRRLREVLPWAALDASDPVDASGWLGWVTVRGERLPVVDLNVLVHGEPTPRVLGSRILVLECQSRGVKKTVGALAGQVFAMALDENSGFAERFDPCDVLGSFLARMA